MVSSQASIPKPVLLCYDVDVVGDGELDVSDIEALWAVEELHHFCDAEGKEVDVGFLWISCEEFVPCLQGVHESSLHGINALAWTVMEERRFTFTVDKNPKNILHF